MCTFGLAIKIKDPGPVFFSQTRIGQNGKKFKIYKFRSMYMDAEDRKKKLLKQNTYGEESLMFKLDDDPRIIKGIGHFIMDYSIYDVMEAGFNKVVFVIRKDLLADFDAVIGQRMKNKGVQIEYAFQEIDDVPPAYKEKTINRTKPWGTGQAILAAKDKIHEPFVVINADDYYGKEGFVKLAEYLKNGGDCCMAGFVLKNTLSDNGTVTRGICVEEDGWLKEVVETKGIGKDTELDMESLVSMNMWGLRPEFMDLLEKGFVEFFENGGQGEFLIPTYIGELLEKKAIDVKVLKSNDTWYGMTYKEDGPAVRENIERLVKEGLYPEEF